MTTDVASWCQGVAWITSVEGSGSSLRLTVPEAPAVDVAPDGEGLVVSASLEAGAGALAGLPGASDEDRRRSFDALVRETEAARGGLLSVVMEGDAARITHAVFADGMTRQAFLAAAGEVAKTARQLRAALEAWSAGAEDLRRMEEQAAEPEPQPEPQAAAAPVPAPEPVPEPATQPVVVPEPVIAAPPPAPAPTVPQAPVWGPTHVVPMGGANAWAAPDPTLAPSAHLEPGAEVRLLQRRGDWAQVDASNGWSAWVDARLLVAR